MKRFCYRAFTVLEILLSLAICSALFAAVAAAMTAASQAVSNNQAQAMLSMSGRTALTRLLDQIREGIGHLPYTQSGAAYTGYLNGSPMIKDIGISLVCEDPDGTPIAYTYWLDQSDPSNGKILMKRQAPSMTATTNTLLEGVTRFEVSMWPGKSEYNRSGQYDTAVRACISLDVTDRSRRQPMVLSLSGSSVPRRNVWSGAHLSFSIDQAIADNLGIIR